MLEQKFVMIIGKQTSYWSKSVFFSVCQLKKGNNVCFKRSKTNHSSEFITIFDCLCFFETDINDRFSSQNNVQDDMNKSKYKILTF